MTAQLSGATTAERPSIDIAELATQVKRTPTASGALINQWLEQWKTKNQKRNAPRGFWDALSDATGIGSEHLKQRVKRAEAQEEIERTRMRSSAAATDDTEAPAPTSSVAVPIEPVVDPAAGEPGTDLAVDHTVEGEYVDDGDGQFVLPATAAEADQMLGELGLVATAVEWQRAALVYARVWVADSPGRPTEKVNSDLLTPTQYAAIRIHGLSSKTTVRRYWRIWQRAIDEGLAEPAKLGDRVQLPTVDWAEYFAPPEVEEPEESSAIPDGYEAFEADERAEEDDDSVEPAPQHNGTDPSTTAADVPVLPPESTAGSATADADRDTLPTTRPDHPDDVEWQFANNVWATSIDCWRCCELDKIARRAANLYAKTVQLDGQMTIRLAQKWTDAELTQIDCIIEQLTGTQNLLAEMRLRYRPGPPVDDEIQRQRTCPA